ncbi:MAG: sugar phosphate nucleotidyltransferase [Candidatus Bathyarchaeota archaeon]|nr:sugar phosphate nucleotidyltransferase [Candidatus Bathyarchaeota archaeon]
MIKKVVIPAAGLGTRLLPITKELPKEMLPLFFKGKDDKVHLKPMLQAIFEQLYDEGFREFGFIVGRGKRAIEDHFTPDYSFVEYLKNKNKQELTGELQEFYRKISDSILVFINQPKPTGFADAVYQARVFTQNEPFLMHAGDDLVFSRNNRHLKRLMKIFGQRNADVAFLVEEVEDPQKYGVVIGKEVEPYLFEVENVIEKPKKPISNLAVIALYVFNPVIYEGIERAKPDEKGEMQIADAIQVLLKRRCKIYALKLRPGERRIDIGTPETYLETLKGVLQHPS